jgi:hypothetical protein
MSILQKLALAVILTSPTFSNAASVAKDATKIIQPDNIVICESNVPCQTRTLNGRSYKVIATPRFTVMVAVSHEGNYTRADVSITNHTDAPFAMTPDDFRVEVVTPKPKVLLYVPAANLVLPPAPAQIPAQAPPAPVGNSFITQSPSPVAAETPSPSEIDSPIPSNEKKDEAGTVTTEQNLEATSIAPNQEIRGKVYFERDRRARTVNIVLPIAGLVCEFPYAMKK